ncbi:NUDIX hydrolase [Methylobacterium bullatum]|uniref:NUDIX hydrolase n=1 Tax=Methylobacterium bullatum TaxID=570505 RepID=UPI0030D0A0A8
MTRAQDGFAVEATGALPNPSAVGLVAVIVAATDGEPRALTVRVPGQATGRETGLPAGPLVPEHPTLERGLRAWVERQTQQRLGYVEQLYTFGDRDRQGDDSAGLHSLSVAYLALVREMRSASLPDASWHNWYAFLPWEDWRAGRPETLDGIEAKLLAWAAGALDSKIRRRREDRLGLTFGIGGGAWNEERVLERYELLFEAGLIPEAQGQAGEAHATDIATTGRPMTFDHRRVLATAIGRLRGKIKYRPVVFELMPPTFTLFQLQRTVEALSGANLHKQNFRRLVAQQGLVEETDEVTSGAAGRPARLVRFRREVLLERPAPGFRLTPSRRSS